MNLSSPSTFYEIGPQSPCWPLYVLRTYIFDLDGTVYLGNVMLPFAGEAISTLRELGKRTVFLSNNPSQTRNQYAQKLTRLGLQTSANTLSIHPP